MARAPGQCTLQVQLPLRARGLRRGRTQVHGGLRAVLGAREGRRGPRGAHGISTLPVGNFFGPGPLRAQAVTDGLSEALLRQLAQDCEGRGVPFTFEQLKALATQVYQLAALTSSGECTARLRASSRSHTRGMRWGSPNCPPRVSIPRLWLRGEQRSSVARTRISWKRALRLPTRRGSRPLQGPPKGAEPARQIQGARARVQP